VLDSISRLFENEPPPKDYSAILERLSATFQVPVPQVAESPSINRSLYSPTSPKTYSPFKDFPATLPNSRRLSSQGIDQVSYRLRSSVTSFIGAVWSKKVFQSGR
jgi:hypothetical protein